MEKIIPVVALAATLSGCSLFQTKPEPPACAENTSYKKYDIPMPARPVLNIDTLGPASNAGQAARAYELDLINLTEYAIALENIIRPIAEGPNTTEVTPSKEASPEEPKHWWDRFF